MKDLWVFVLFTLVLLWLLKRWQDRRYILLATKLPGVWWHIITGFGAILTSKGTIATTYRVGCKYGKNVVCYAGPFPLLLTHDPETIKDIFNSKQGINKPEAFYSRLSNAIGRGLITLSDPRWHNQRKIVNTAFNNKNLLSFIPIFNEEVNRITQYIDADISNSIRPTLQTHFREFTVRIAMRTTVGRNGDKTEYSAVQLAKNMRHLLLYSVEMMLNQFYSLGITRKIASATYLNEGVRCTANMLSFMRDSFLKHGGADPSYENIITPVVAYISKGVEEHRIEEENGLVDMMHIFLGAFETTSTTLFYILLMLGMYPEHQQRAYEEVCALFPDDDDEQFEVSCEDINAMVFIDMIMNETMRVLPIIPHVGREIRHEDLTLSSGVVLPRGLNVVVDLFSLHRNKDIWGPDADKFNPYNFLPDNINARHPFAFIPFTKGARFCIGWRYAQLSIKATLAKLIKRYKFTAHCKLEDLRLENHVTSQLAVEPDIFVEHRRKPNSV